MSDFDEDEEPELEADTDAELEAELDDDPIINLDETAEVRRVPSISGMSPVAHRTQPAVVVSMRRGWRRRWWPTARWVVLGALAVGLGVPLAQQCGGGDVAAQASRH